MAARDLPWRIVGHPAVRFLALGVLIFWAHARWGGGAAPSIDQAPRASLVEAFAREHGRAPDATERRALVEEWARDEALVQHAYALRLHETDSVVRRRLIQDVEFLLEAEAELPTEAQMRARYLAERERFAAPARRSFEHAFVAGNDPTARPRARELRAELVAGAQPGTLGEPSSLGPRIEAISESRLAARVGEGVARAIFGLEVGVWSEPLASSLGWHLVRVVGTQPGRPRAYEEVEAQLRDELSEQARREALTRGRAELRARYIEGDGP